MKYLIPSIFCFFLGAQAVFDPLFNTEHRPEGASNQIFQSFSWEDDDFCCVRKSNVSICSGTIEASLGQKLKVIKKTGDLEDPMHKDILNELQILASLPVHAGIPRISPIVCYESQAKNFSTFSELKPGITLFDWLNRNGNKITKGQVDLIIFEIGQIIRHLQAHQIVHGDISKSNIIIAPDGRTISLVDFGIAIHFDAANVTKNVVRGGLYRCEEDIIRSIDHDLLCLKSMLEGIVLDFAEFQNHSVNGTDEEFLEFVRQLEQPQGINLSHNFEDQFSVYGAQYGAKRTLSSSFVPLAFEGESQEDFLQKLASIKAQAPQEIQLLETSDEDKFESPKKNQPSGFGRFQSFTSPPKAQSGLNRFVPSTPQVRPNSKLSRFAPPKTSRLAFD